MVTFDSSLPGTPAEEWDADPRMHDRPALDLAGVTELLVVAAHPDDETLGAGGLIAHCAGRGIRVRVVVVTDGGQGGDAARRTAELGAAMSLLGASALSLGFRDGGTREHRDAIRTALAPHLEGADLIASPWVGDGHRDHRVVGEIVQELASGRRHLQYPVWLWHWARPESEEVPWDRFVSVSIDSRAKARALGAYVSQTEGSDPVLRADLLPNFARDTELFVQTGGAHVLGRTYFDALYSRNDDPWRLATRWYEARKRALTVASLPRERYATGLEVGCSVGTLTEALAPRVDDLLAVDISAAAVASARKRVGGGVRVECVDVLERFPTGPFDLIVLSEVGYYFSRTDLDALLDRVQAALAPGGTVVACHWRHPVDDYPLSGDEVHDIIGRRGLPIIASHREADFLLEVLSLDARSVAQSAGLA